MESIWLKTAECRSFPTLKQDIKTDVLIIGGGITGVLCAYMLDKAGADYTLIEADKICSGITKNTTAKLTFQHGLIFDKLINTFGMDIAKIYLEANKAALKEYGKMCSKIDCDYEERDSFVFSLNNKQKIKKEVAALNKLGEPAEFVSNLPLPFPVAGAVKVSNQAQFNPIKFVSAISKNLRIFENTKVLELKPQLAITNRGKISAKKIIVATHFPLLNKHGAYFLKLHQHRSYVLALKNAQNLNGMFVDEADKGISLRTYGNLLLLGGGGHRTGKKGGGWQELTEFARKNYPNAAVIARWATQDCISLDNIPYIGQYSKRIPNLYVASGFNKWGFSSAMVAAKILTDTVLGKSNRHACAFSPQRTMLHPSLLANAAESIIGLLTPTAPRCPHLGCALKYNKQEHSWDCPCHGSRFSENGNLIDNPATDDARI